jgi:hypothetical protein
MFSQPHREARGRLRGAPERLHVRRRVLAATSATLIAALVALPTTVALAGADTSLPGGTGSAERPALPQLVTPGELLSADQLQQLLATLPLADLSAAQLAHHLAALEGVSALAQLKLGLLSQKLLGVASLEESLREAIEQLGAGAKLGELAGSEGVANLLPKLEAALESKLGGLGLLETLLGKLPGGGLSGVEGALGSLSLTQLVGSLLSTAHGEETPLKEELLAKLATLANGLFGELGSEGKLESLLGGLQMTGEFAPKSVKEVSEELKTTPEKVSEELGQTGEQLPEDATMLTAPLTNGKLIGMAPAVKGLVTGVLGDLAEGPGGESKEEGGENPGGGSGEEKGSGENKNEGGSGNGTSESKGGSGTGEGKGGSGGGGQGGPGGSGSGGTGGSTTVVLTLPANATTQGAAGKQATGSVSVVAHRVKGRVATIVLHVPSAGTASISGKGVRGVSKQAAKAERLTLRVPLTAATAASLRHHRHHLTVRLTAAFHPGSGSNSSTTVTVAFT